MTCRLASSVDDVEPEMGENLHHLLLIIVIILLLLLHFHFLLIKRRPL
jgi:hypothetical protein